MWHEGLKPPTGKSSMPPQLPHRAQPEVQPAATRTEIRVCQGARDLCVRFESCARARCVYAV
eukprot:2685614-Prymnesium_polylepis.1